jgi:hypothetical protein
MSAPDGPSVVQGLSRKDMETMGPLLNVRSPTSQGDEEACSNIIGALFGPPAGKDCLTAANLQSIGQRLARRVECEKRAGEKRRRGVGEKDDGEDDGEPAPKRQRTGATAARMLKWVAQGGLRVCGGIALTQKMLAKLLVTIRALLDNTDMRIDFYALDERVQDAPGAPQSVLFVGLGRPCIYAAPRLVLLFPCDRNGDVVDARKWAKALNGDDTKRREWARTEVTALGLPPDPIKGGPQRKTLLAWAEEDLLPRPRRYETLPACTLDHCLSEHLLNGGRDAIEAAMDDRVLFTFATP